MSTIFPSLPPLVIAPTPLAVAMYASADKAVSSHAERMGSHLGSLS